MSETTPTPQRQTIARDLRAFVFAELEAQERTQAWLAQKVGIKQPNLCKMLRETTNVHAETVARICAALGYEASLTFRRAEKKN